MNNYFIKFFTHFISDKNKRKQVRNILLYGDVVLPSLPKKTPIGYSINGENNKIIIIENGVERDLKVGETIAGLNIEINGNNNVVKLELPIKAENSFIKIGNDNVSVDIGSTSIFVKVFIVCCWGCHQFVKIGRNTTIIGAEIHCDEKSGCIIGEDCMFSNSIQI